MTGIKPDPRQSNVSEMWVGLYARHSDDSDRMSTAPRGVMASTKFYASKLFTT